MEPTSGIGLYAGSFDPITLGHTEIVEKALGVFGKIIVLVADAPGKEYFLDAQTRVKLCQETFAGNDRVQVLRGTGLTAKQAVSLKACALIRGLRTASDFEYEFRLEAANKIIEPTLATVFFMSRPDLAFVSSSLAKRFWEADVDISGIVPAPVIKEFTRSQNAAGK
mgnify:CR=1 FL=1